MKTLRLMLVEDDTLQIEQLKATFEASQRLTVAGAYTDPQAALDALGDVAPDILLSDIGMPGMSGLELIRRASEKLPSLDIIALTVHEDPSTVFEAIKAGASGYLLKSSTDEELVNAIFDTAEGGSRITPKIARMIIMNMQGEVADAAFQLTAREVEILRKIEMGRTYKEIAGEVELSVHTVNSHVKRIFSKLHARNKQEAVFFAKKRGIL
ncbi:MAG: response regulator transcription factor [Nitrospinae bacterium]|nr:response regulator transcription factor [Nitrospinota bacterium]